MHELHIADAVLPLLLRAVEAAMPGEDDKDMLPIEMTTAQEALGTLRVMQAYEVAVHRVVLTSEQIEALELLASVGLDMLAEGMSDAEANAVEAALQPIA